MMKRIAIDMDDVLADTTLKIIAETNKRLGTAYTKEAISNPEIAKEFYQQYYPLRNFLWEKGFFRDLPVFDDAIDVVKKLQEQYEIFIVSAATEFPNSLAEKLEWLEEHFPFIGWTHTVFCGHKYMIKADYLIDDHEKNLVKFEGKGLLFDAPHNGHLQEYTRVYSWKEVEGLLLPEGTNV
ncbi:5' nucleotidase, NT5C type [Flectobacillus major]|uniref:5' nucleotidase, NT5C type n=1 Tax=Flectobacillus major TaxID=103 RepID=UPI001E288C12|nr:5'-3'-deoxyribonucleotidase [Flectobacillus major]